MTRTFIALARLANERPWLVTAALIVLGAILGPLAVLGAVSLICSGEIWKWALFAAIMCAGISAMS